METKLLEEFKIKWSNNINREDSATNKTCQFQLLHRFNSQRSNTVLIFKHKETGIRAGIKVFFRPGNITKFVNTTVVRMVESYEKTLEHIGDGKKHLVRLKTDRIAAFKHGVVGIVMEALDGNGSDLFNLLKHDNELRYRILKRGFCCLFENLLYPLWFIYKGTIGDVKTENIMFRKHTGTDNFDLVLTDMDCIATHTSRINGDNKTLPCSTHTYIDPFQVKDDIYNTNSQHIVSAELYRFGVCLYEMYTGEILMTGSPARHILNVDLLLGYQTHLINAAVKLPIPLQTVYLLCIIGDRGANVENRVIDVINALKSTN
jgi:hypothetical protein